MYLANVADHFFEHLLIYINDCSYNVYINITINVINKGKSMGCLFDF